MHEGSFFMKSEMHEVPDMINIINSYNASRDN